MAIVVLEKPCSFQFHNPSNGLCSSFEMQPTRKTQSREPVATYTGMRSVAVAWRGVARKMDGQGTTAHQTDAAQKVALRWPQRRKLSEGASAVIQARLPQTHSLLLVFAFLGVNFTVSNTLRGFSGSSTPRSAHAYLTRSSQQTRH